MTTPAPALHCSTCNTGTHDYTCTCPTLQHLQYWHPALHLHLPYIAAPAILAPSPTPALHCSSCNTGTQPYTCPTWQQLQYWHPALHLPYIAAAAVLAPSPTPAPALHCSTCSRAVHLPYILCVSL